MSENLYIESGRKVAVFALIIPSRNPRAWAQRFEGEEELSAWWEVFASGSDAFVIVDVILPAMLCLVLIWEAGVEARGNELEGHGDTLLIAGIVTHDGGNWVN